MANKKTDILGLIQEEASNLLTMLGIQAELQVSQQAETYLLNITSEDSGILIGYHGETLQSFQLILSLLVAKKLDEFVRIIANVGDYREKREEKLRQMAFDAAKRAKETNQEVVLTNLLPWQRRIIHMTLQEAGDVESESQGEEQNRLLIIKPKQLQTS